MSALSRTEREKRVYHRVHAAVVDGRVRRVKFCPGCSRDRIAEDGAPDVEFWVWKRRNGTATFYTLCKDCERRTRRERKAMDPEWAKRQREAQRAAQKRWLEKPDNAEKSRASSRRYQRRLRENDPEGVNELARMYYAMRRERAGKPARRRKTVIDGTSPRILSEPFRRWLSAYALVSGFAGNDEGLARHLKLSPRRVRSLFAGEHEKVALDVVSRALTSAVWTVEVDEKLIVTLDDLYGEETFPTKKTIKKGGGS